MENLKIKVNNESESKEAQELFFELGYSKKAKFTKEDFVDFDGWICALDDGSCAYCPTSSLDREVTISQLKDMVVLKRNDWKDHTHEDYQKNAWFVIGKDAYMMQDGKWELRGDTPYLLESKPISKTKEDLDMKTSEMKQRLIKNGCSAELAEEILLKTKGEYEAVIKSSTTNSWWAWKDNSKYVMNCFNYEDGWFLRSEDYCKFEDFYSGDIIVDDIRNLKQEKSSLTITDKVKYFEMFLKGKKLQYHLGVEVEGKSQWYNLTDKSLHVLQRSDVNIREKPKYVTLNGIEFKTKESLLKHVESNYDLS